MARAKKYIDGLTRTVRKDWKYYKGKKVRSWRLVFDYQTADEQKETIKERYDLKADADLRLSQLEKEHAKKPHTFEHRQMSFADYANSYKKKIESELTTGKTESSKVDVMVAFFGNRKLDKIRRIQTKEFKSYLEGLTSEHTKRPLTPRTVHSYLERLRALLNEAKADEYIESVPNISGLIDRKLERKRTDRTITTSQLFHLLALADLPIVDKKGRFRGGKFKDRSHLKLPLIASHEIGCRVGELKDVKRTDIVHVDHERKSGIVRIINQKASKLKGELVVKHVAISGWLYDEIMKHGLLELPADDRVFMRYPNYKTAWNTLRELAGLSEINWHDLRAVNATNRKFAGQDFELLQEQVGHAKGSPVTEAHYIRPNWEQAMDGMQDYNAYMDFQRQRATEAEQKSEAVN